MGQTVERVVEVPQIQTQTVYRDVPKVQVQEVVRQQPVIQKQIVEKIVEIPHIQTVQPVITERQVVQTYEDISYTTNVQQGEPVARTVAGGMVNTGVVNTGVINTGQTYASGSYGGAYVGAQGGAYVAAPGGAYVGGYVGGYGGVVSEPMSAAPVISTAPVTVQHSYGATASYGAPIGSHII